jgi:hypothetical protein
MRFYSTWCWLVAAVISSHVVPSLLSAQITAAPENSAPNLVERPAFFPLQRSDATIPTPSPPVIGAVRTSVSVPSPRAGTWVGAIGGATVGGFYAWGLGGEGWLRDSDTPKMILAGAAVGAAVGYTVDLIVHQLRR